MNQALDVLRSRIEDDGYDAFGRDPHLIAKVQPICEMLLERHFRAHVEGAERLPAGRALFVANHGGALPWDVIMLQAALRKETAGKMELRPLLEDAIVSAPFLGTFMNRLGCVRASQENATRLLAREEPVAVFPEGLLGLGKRYRRRYKLQRFGRGGFVRLAIRTQTVIVPVAVLGAEDAAPLLLRWELAGKGLGLPYLPITPLFPLFGPLGLLPLPSRWSIRIGHPIDVARQVADPEDAIAVGEVTARIREQLQTDLRDLQDSRVKTFPWSRGRRRAKAE